MQLIAGRDYYIDQRGLLVFTEAYLLQRGYCCGSGCRHCPYPPVVPNEDSTKDKQRGSSAEE
jgi:hypothetical protein